MSFDKSSRHIRVLIWLLWKSFCCMFVFSVCEEKIICRWFCFSFNLVSGFRILGETIFCVFSCCLFWLWLLFVVFGLVGVFWRLGIFFLFLFGVFRGLLFRRFLRQLRVFRFRRSVRRRRSLSPLRFWLAQV